MILLSCTKPLIYAILYTYFMQIVLQPWLSFAGKSRLVDLEQSPIWNLSLWKSDTLNFHCQNRTVRTLASMSLTKSVSYIFHASHCKSLMKTKPKVHELFRFQANAKTLSMGCAGIWFREFFLINNDQSKNLIWKCCLQNCCHFVFRPIMHWPDTLIKYME